MKIYVGIITIILCHHMYGCDTDLVQHRESQLKQKRSALCVLLENKASKARIIADAYSLAITATRYEQLTAQKKHPSLITKIRLLFGLKKHQ